MHTQSNTKSNIPRSKNMHANNQRECVCISKLVRLEMGW
jgi:hypothetical protein